MSQDKVNEQAIWAGAWLSFGVLMLIVPRQFEWGLYDKIVDLATAVGTVGAVVVSLWLASSERRQRDKQDLLGARLASARVVADLEEPLNRLQLFNVTADFEDLLEAQKVTADVEMATTNRLGEFIILVSQEQWILEPGLLERLVPLGDNVAHRLQYGCQLLVALSHTLDDYRSHWPKIPLLQKKTLIEDWHRVCLKAERYISVAYAACQDAAEVGAPEPEPAEIYGDPYP